MEKKTIYTIAIITFLTILAAVIPVVIMGDREGKPVLHSGFIYKANITIEWYNGTFVDLIRIVHECVREWNLTATARGDKVTITVYIPTFEYVLDRENLKANVTFYDVKVWVYYRGEEAFVNMNEPGLTTFYIVIGEKGDVGVAGETETFSGNMENRRVTNHDKLCIV